MNTKHTPGPWTALHYGSRPQSVSGLNGAVSVCSFSAKLYDHNKAQACANAHLIAAAPDLLVVAELLWDAVDMMNDGPDDSDVEYARRKLHEAARKARAAIQKARGQS